MQRSLAILAMAWSLVATLPVVAGTWADDAFVTGPNGVVRVLYDWDGETLAAGNFNHIGGFPAHAMARRTGALAWEQFGPTLPVTGIVDICEHDGLLHALGTVTGGSRVWRLVGDDWQPVGGTIAAGELVSYAGGLHAGSLRWDGSTWVDVLQTDGAVYDLAVLGDLLVAGGAFTSAGGIETGHVLAWDGHQVLAAFPGQARSVYHLAAFAGELFAAPGWRDEGDSAIQVWSASGWTDVPAYGTVYHSRSVIGMTANEDRLLVCIRGNAILIKMEPEASVYRWDGQTLTRPYYQHDGHRIYTALEDGDGLLVGGDFVRPGSSPCTNLAHWDGSSLSPVCPVGFGASAGPSGSRVSVLEAGPESLAVGGDFPVVGGQWSPGVILRRAATWEPLGACFDWPAALTWHENRLTAIFASNHCPGYAFFGYLQSGSWVFPYFVNDVPLVRDLESWSGRLLLPFGDTVYEILQDIIVVPLTTLDDGAFLDLAVIDDVLLAAGEFAAIGGVAANGIAAFDGTTWSPLGEGLPTTVLKIGVWQGRPVVVRVGDSGPRRRWSPPGTVRPGPTSGPDAASGWPIDLSLQEYAGRLYVGGTFLQVDGQPIANLACWTGDKWQSPGDVDGWVRALAVYEGLLWVGGEFDHAGGYPASGLTWYRSDPTAVDDDLPAAPALTLTAAPNPFNPQTTLLFSLARAQQVRIDVYDAAGRHLVTLSDGHRGAGDQRVVWSGRDAGGRALPSGAYLVRLRTESGAASTRVSLIK
jgi:hypothetical protein